MNKFSIYIVLSFSFLLLFYFYSFAQQYELSNHIAFLKDGEVLVSDSKSENPKQITSDSGKVEDFQFSPSLKYLAYSSIIRYEDEPGLWEDTEKVPQKAVCSIVIMELQTKKIVKEILPAEDTWIYISRWLPNNILLYYGSSGFDVSGFYLFDIKNNVKKEIEYNKESIITSSYYSNDGSLMLYVDDSGLGEDYKQNLHLVDLRTNTDMVVISKRSISDIKISNDKNRIAFIEVEEADKNFFDNLWVYDIKKDSLNKLYRGPASAKSGEENEISWSFDDQDIGMFFPPQALIIEVNHLDSIQRIGGTGFTWIENNKIIFSQGKNIYSYSLNTNKSMLLVKDAVKPTFLREKSY